MPEFVRLQIRPGQPGPTIELSSSGAQVPAVPLLPLTVPPAPPADSAALWQVLPEPIRQSLRQVQNVPLWLDIDPCLHDIATWPWELLAPPKSPPFACMPRAPLVRAFPAHRTAPLITPGVPRLLALTATPRDQPTIDVQPLLHLLRDLHDPQRLLVTIEQHCSPQQLPILIRDTQPDLLLILAHGTPGDMILEDERGDSVPLPASELATFLSGALTRVVVLASCHGATATDDGQSVATTLLEQGALAVVAMRGRIPQNAADAFLRGMLRGLAHPYPLEVAVAYGRQALIAALGAAGGDWALPVCWQQVLGRPLLPLTLPPEQVARQGARWLEKQADNPSLAGKLATGGWIGFLLFASLHTLLWPAAVTVPAIVTLLESLGLNIASGYLGNALEDMVRRTFGRPRETVSQAEVLQALMRVVDQHADAAAEIAAFAHDTGALQQTLGAINAEVSGSRALLTGIDHDLQRHGAVLNDLGDFVRQELAGLRVDLRQGFTAILERLDDGAAERQAQEQAQLADYLDWVVKSYQSVRLSRFIDERRGSEERVEELYLRDVYTALTTDANNVPSVIVREVVRPAHRVRRLLRYFQRRTADRVPPEQVRLFQYRLPVSAEPAERRQRPTGPDGDHWLSDDLPDEIEPQQKLSIRLLRPELAVELIAPRAAHPHRLVLLGDPGSGKSTVLRYLAVLLAHAYRIDVPLDLEGWRGLPARVPLLLPLGNITKLLEQNDNADAALWQALEHVLAGANKQVRPALVAALPRLLRNNAVVLFDGLDELSAEPGSDGAAGPRQQTALAIRRLAHAFPQTPIVVTCRVLPYRTPDLRPSATPWQFSDDRDWQERTVQPFTFGQIQRFIALWYRADALASQSDPDEAAERAATLSDELAESAALREAIAPGSSVPQPDPPASPLLLTMLTILHANAEGRQLPQERDELYEALVTLLLHRWEPRRSQPDYERDDLLHRLDISGLTTVEPLRSVLHEVAYDAHTLARSGGDGRGIIDARQLKGRLVEFFCEDLGCSDAVALTKVRTFLDVLQEEAGLLQGLDQNAYALPHLTFQEYLAACHIARHPERAMVEMAYTHWCSADADRWRVVILLLMGRLCQQEKVEGHGSAWLEHLCDACHADNSPKSLDQRQRDALLALDCYSVLDRRSSLRGRVARKRKAELHAALQTIVPPTGLQTTDLHLPPDERARAAVALTRLGTVEQPGDTRPGVCTLEPAWCALPAGTYPIAEGEAKARLSAFRIARYPVTVWQFRQFWQAGGYDDEQWWTKEGWQWLQPGGFRYSHQEQGRITQPFLWDNPDWTAANQPVIGVSWYEAVAFCRWLTAQGHAQGWLREDEQIRLPTEAEWEVAAMWDAQSGQMRAWQPPDGELWQNVEEAGIGRTAPVGLFPPGSSPCGALDMAGNVWEWCASPYSGYPTEAASLSPDYPPRQIGPSLRGGSYYSQNTRSGWGARSWDYPLARDDLGGCRVCAVVAPRSVKR